MMEQYEFGVRKTHGLESTVVVGSPVLCNHSSTIFDANKRSTHQLIQYEILYLGRSMPGGGGL